MRERRLYMTLGIVLAILALGVAYATVLNVDLSITGTATGLASEDNFDVKFTHVSAVTGTGEVDTSESTAEISSDPTQGTFYFKGFETDSPTALYPAKWITASILFSLNFGLQILYQTITKKLLKTLIFGLFCAIILLTRNTRGYKEAL